MKEIRYGECSIYPEIEECSAYKEMFEITELIPITEVTLLEKSTKHEGIILYKKYWNFWIRDGVKGDLRSDRFFRDYENNNNNTSKLLKDIGLPVNYPKSEIDIWERTAKLWNWLGSNVKNNGSTYATISSQPNEWPSLLDYSKFYATHGYLVWAACFSKAHLFATLLGCSVTVTQRYRIAIAEAHHTESGAPATATHIYVALYVSNRWFYLDPTEIPFTSFPSFSKRHSIGVASFPTVDYEHPYKIIPLPLSGFEYVPYLPP